MAGDNLPFKLHLHDRGRLAELGNQLDVVEADLALLEHLWPESHRIAIGFFREGGQRPQADTVAVFQRIDVGVGKRDVDDVGDAGLVARGGGHPEHVVIAPDDIDRMMGAQQLDDVLRAGTAVKNIAENMKLIDRQPFDQIRESGDKGVRPADVHDG